MWKKILEDEDHFSGGDGEDEDHVSGDDDDCDDERGDQYEPVGSVADV